MARFYIDEVRCEMNGMPIAPEIIAEVKVRTDDGESFYMTLAEVEGIPNFFKTDDGVLDRIVGTELDDEAVEELEEFCLEIEDYYDIFVEEDSEWKQLYRLLIFLVRADWPEVTEMKELATGKWLDEIEVPMSDLEENYMEDLEEEEEDD